jgi:DNA-binding FadR family transcriptional regulator
VIIPTHEPEIVAAEAKRLWRGDSEKVPTTSLRTVAFRGVQIDSRYRKAHEFETMIAAASRFDAEEISMIDAIWCDSKACAYYHIILKKGVPKEWANVICTSFAAYILQVDGGYNGIDVEDINLNVIAYEDPCWPEYDNE